MRCPLTRRGKPRARAVRTPGGPQQLFGKIGDEPFLGDKALLEAAGDHVAPNHPRAGGLEALERADKALYEAKHDGRNCTYFEGTRFGDTAHGILHQYGCQKNGILDE